MERVQRLSLYPNPTAGPLNLELEGFDPQPFVMELFDAAGKQVLRREFQLGDGARQFDLSDLGPGHYVLRLRNAQKVWTKEVIVVR